jgi:folate-dependent tRNA-U54 methylase TrmFO/GidA
MVNLTRIYTRTGDDGTTNLGDMSRTGKNDPRLKAYADVDEANSSTFQPMNINFGLFPSIEVKKGDDKKSLLSKNALDHLKKWKNLHNI